MKETSFPAANRYNLTNNLAGLKVAHKGVDVWPRSDRNELSSFRQFQMENNNFILIEFKTEN